ncbi:glutaredoxin-like [Actinia tenebrosa]|uniref:Glutaredoxin-like n=1 Tax=Actinia tenebrosa TaxID=6105 RepID=A0A6P8I2Q2_ACTTE|nr:glutaredoxin-like [Actinia tenebrosa]
MGLSGSTMPNAAAKKLVDEMIASNKVVVFSKTYCPYCDMAKAALNKTGLKDFLVIELDGRNDGDSIQDYLRTLSGIRSVPQLFVDKKFIADGSKTKAMQASGELVPILKNCGAL